MLQKHVLGALNGPFNGRLVHCQASLPLVVAYLTLLKAFVVSSVILFPVVNRKSIPFLVCLVIYVPQVSDILDLYSISRN